MRKGFHTPERAPARPRWWPESEPWPPSRTRVHQWRRRRARFFRRFALIALIVVLLGAYGALSLAWLIANNVGLVAPSTPGTGAVALMLGVFVVIGALVTFRTMTRRVGTPIRDVMDAAERVAAGDYSVRVKEYGPLPIRGLSRAFNTMTERLQKHDRQRRDLMADVAHELRTPLTVIQGKLEGLLDNVYQRDDRQLTELLEQARVLSRLIEDLRTLALSDSGALKLQMEMTDVAGLARDVARSFITDQLALSIDAPDDLPPIPIDPVRIREVLTNVLTNAVRHTPPGGSITVRVTRATPDGIRIQIEDTGSGMRPDEVERAFDRFHKGPGSRGAGLGLSIARSLVEAHGGQIHASSTPGRGTTMTVTLPNGSRNHGPNHSDEEIRSYR
jgi:signal transduction histidine kinase